jgi:hypothetical protein
MKWFKHMSNSSTGGQFIAALEDEFGLEGYARYFKLLEIVALKAENGSCFSATYPAEKWRTFLKAKQNKLVSFLVYLEKQQQINLELNGNLITVEIPKMEALKDNHTSGQTKKLRSDLALEKEKEKELDKEEEKKVKEKKETSVSFLPNKPQKNKTALPEDFQITEALKAWATENFGLLENGFLQRETEKWRDHHTANGNKFINWEAAWRKWMRQAVEWSRNRTVNGGASVSSNGRYSVVKDEDIEESGFITI